MYYFLFNYASLLHKKYTFLCSTANLLHKIAQFNMINMPLYANLGRNRQILGRNKQI